MFSCAKMHVITQSCLLFIWAHTLSVVTAGDCKREDFINGPDYDEHFDTTGLAPSYGPGTEVRVPCHIGFVGFFKLRCMLVGWTHVGSKCEPQTCGHPGDADFADYELVEGGDFVFGAVVQYTCQKGYQMVSRIRSRRCDVTGWDGVVPVCQPILCPVIDATNDVQIFGERYKANYGNILRFSCKSRDLVLSGVAEIECDENGDWSDPAPTCIEVKCTPPTIDNGSILGNIAEYDKDQTLRFECHTKFRRSHHLPSKCTRVGMRADWIPTPLCDPVTCTLSLTKIPGTGYEPERIVFSPDDTVTVICDSRHFIGSHSEDTKVITCLDHGEWERSPVCQEITCNNPRLETGVAWTNDWRGQQRKVDNTVTYTCSKGYKDTGVGKTATCTRDGWTPKPLCEAKSCPRPRLAAGGDINIEGLPDNDGPIPPGHNLTFRCLSRGKRLSGISEAVLLLTCGEDEKWNHPIPSSCEDVICPSPPAALQLDCQPNHPIQFGHTLTIRCIDTLKRLKGKSELTCGENGQWNDALPSCEVPCVVPELPANVQITNQPQTSPVNGDMLQFQCTDGLYLQGSRQIQCLATGTWSYKVPICSISNSCRAPLVPENAELRESKSEYIHGEVVYYVCPSLYIVDGNHTCQNGQWTGHAACLIPCVVPELPANVQITNQHQPSPVNGDMLQFQCTDALYLQGSPQIQCLATGTWSDKVPICSRRTLPKTGVSAVERSHTVESNSCGAPLVPESAELRDRRKSEYSDGEEVHYVCPSLYIVDGYLTCQNGQWTGHAACLKPCTVNKEDLNQHNIEFLLSGIDKLYAEHNDFLTFLCKAGYRRGANIVMRKKCINGEMTLPSCSPIV